MSDTLDPHDGPVAPVEPAAPKFELTEDGNQVKYGDKTFVTQEALRQSREEARLLRDEFKKLEPVIPEFEEFIRTKQSRVASQRTAIAPRGDDDYSDEELDGVASLRGYYMSDNSLDRTRARQDLDLMTRVSDRRVQRQVDPLRNSTAADKAARNRQEAIGRQFSDGRPIADSRFVQEAFNALPAELAADPNVGNLAQVLAAGLEYLDKRKNGTLSDRKEPVFSEGSRGRFHGDEGQLSQFDVAAARARGKSVEDWQKLQGKNSPRNTGREQADGSYVFEDGV